MAQDPTPPPSPAPPALVNYALLLAKRLRAQPRTIVSHNKEELVSIVILPTIGVDKAIAELERLAGKPKPKTEGKRKAEGNRK